MLNEIVFYFSDPNILRKFFLKTRGGFRDSLILLAVSEWVKVTQLCPALCNTMYCSPPRSSVHGIIQARMLEWVAIPFPGDLPYPGIKPRSLALQAGSLPSEPSYKTDKQNCKIFEVYNMMICMLWNDSPLIELINNHLTHLPFISVCVRTFNFYLPGKFQWYNPVLPTIVTIF